MVPTRRLYQINSSRILQEIRQNRGKSRIAIAEDLDLDRSTITKVVRQLLEYQAFKEAAQELSARPILERDVFKRAGALVDDQSRPDADEELVEVSIFELIEAFHQVVSRLENKELLEIDLEKLSLTEIINDVMERLTREKNLTFEELLGEKKDRRRIVYTFLALLELVKLKMVKAYQTAAFGVIRIFPAVES